MTVICDLEEYEGNTGGFTRPLVSSGRYYLISWTAEKEMIFEIPTGGAYLMREGPNLLQFTKKEQCYAVGKELRTKFRITSYVRWIDCYECCAENKPIGVSEKVEKDRVGVGNVSRSIGKNLQPVNVKFTDYNVFD